MKRTSALIALLVVVLLAAPSFAAGKKKDPLAAWKPKFDPSGAKYTYILSNISHPVIEGIAVGYRIRDAVWKKSGGRLYVDFRPLAQLGGEKDVIAKLKLGAVQGMMASSVAAANISDRLGIVNLPYVVDTFDKLEKFRNDPDLWVPYANSAQNQGLLVADITGYGTYGWATTTPVRTLADAKKVNFRIAQAPVNADCYKAWGLKFTVLPWPDVPQALQTGVINGLDHTAIVCNITKKFTIAKYFTELNYAQGLFIHLLNKRWFNKLPKDLQTILLDTIKEESAKTRVLTRKQQADQIAKAKAAGIEFFTLSAADKAELIKEAQPVYAKWGKKIGIDYLAKVRTTLGD
ncbi:C4-dicarboxylate ABC transporter substrate-binding protein [Geothermobacter hydrogeniphilus]|uniref:C4-dicarboxylate ABC transporter substrate-binding protein n=1 Tax=Geothermobacter hydrogeniphilus TaxID=1969733 RepID=A0A2K2H6Z3_9BACT|nr:TRAP transporter substrate-binding protein [Geothermobacter hydrogeniphilus]PNU19021.1 C4-dicarboxylate ABC transporter substrate-binding protein [Geothermobacter hydrogeniphilus]